MDQINKSALNCPYWASARLLFIGSILGFIVSSLLSFVRLMTETRLIFMSLKCRSVAISAKGDNFCKFLFAILHTHPLVYFQRKEFAPKGSKFFPLRIHRFSEGRQLYFDIAAFLPLPLIVYPFTLRIFCRQAFFI